MRVVRVVLRLPILALLARRAAIFRCRFHSDLLLEVRFLALEIAEVRYREGDIELTSVLDAQTSLNNARQNTIDQRYNELLARVTLYRVLGQGLAGFAEAP